MAQSKTAIRGMIVVDPAKCLGCHTCEIACAVGHSKTKELMQVIFEEPSAQPRISVKKKGKNFLPLQCRHCKDAACIKACPVKAISRKDAASPVLIDQSKCTGCKKCIEACPFKVIKMSSDGKTAIKCDLCFERLDKGEDPCCASSCPTGAIEFKPVEDIDKLRQEKYLVTFKVK